MGGKLQVRRYFTFAMTRPKLCAWTPFEISHFQPVHCPSKNPISPKVFNRISKTLLQLEVVEGGLMGGKLQVRRYFTFAMTRWKVCTSTTFEISHFQPVHCPSKNPISPKVFNRISKTLVQLEVVEGGLIGGKLQVRRYSTFAMARWKLCTTKTHEISHFQPVHCTSKNPISPKVFNRISKTFLQLKDVEGGHLGAYFQVRRYFSFAMARWKLCPTKTFEIFHIQPVHCTSKNPISPKLPNRFSKTLLQFDVVEGVHMSGKLQVHRYLTFAMTRWKLCASTTFEISHFEPAHCPSKNPISPKVFNRIWKTLLQLEVVEGGLMGGKLQVRRYFTFAMTRRKLCAWTPFEISHFQPVHCPSKNPISPKLINRFSKTLLQLEVVEGGHMGGKFQVRRYFTFAMTRWKVCTSTTFEISHFQPVHCPSKNPISPKLPNRFSKTLLQFDVVEGVHMSGKLQVHRYLTFAMTRWKLCASTTFEISHFEPAHCPSKNPISPKVFNRISKTLLQLEVVEGGLMGGKLQVRRYFTFAMTRRKLCAWTPFEISHFQPVHCPSKNPISPKLINRFSKTLLQLEVVEGGHMGGKFQVRRYFTFAIAPAGFHP